MSVNHYFPTRPTPLAQLPGAVPLDGRDSPDRMVQPDELVAWGGSLANRGETVGRVEQASWRLSEHEAALDELAQRLRALRREFEEQSIRLDPTANQRRGYRAADDSERVGLQLNRCRIAQQVAHDCRLLAQEVAHLRRVRDQVHRAEGVTEHPATLVQRRRVQQSVADAVDTLALVSGEVLDLVPTAPIADSLAALLPHPQESAARPDPTGTVQAPPAPADAPGSSPATSGEPDADTADPSAALLAQLDQLGVPPEASRAQHRTRLTQAGVRVGDHRLAETIRARRQRANAAGESGSAH